MTFAPSAIISYLAIHKDLQIDKFFACDPAGREHLDVPDMQLLM